MFLFLFALNIGSKQASESDVTMFIQKNKECDVIIKCFSLSRTCFAVKPLDSLSFQKISSSCLSIKATTADFLGHWGAAQTSLSSSDDFTVYIVHLTP